MRHKGVDGRNKSGHDGLGGLLLAYPSLMPANLITLLHLAFSSAICLRYSAGLIAIGMLPSSPRRPLSASAFSPALIAALSLSMISAGVSRGAPIPKPPATS